MNELKRMAYLEALGIDSYVSRRQWPGAAVTRRLALAPRTVAALPVAAVPSASAPETGQPVRPLALLADPPPRAKARPAPGPGPQEAAQAAAVPRFSLVTIAAGDWLWLEELVGLPLTTAQVQLVQAMARALLAERARHHVAQFSESTVRADVLQFDWPLHDNRQLDQGEAAAQAGLAGFLARRLEQQGSRALVLLGASGAARVPVRELGVPVIRTISSADMLATPTLKRQAWQDLQALLSSH